MSHLITTITKIENIDNLNIVSFDFYGYTLKMMSLELNPNIKVAKQVKLTIKPTHVSIAKDFKGLLSFENILDAKILSCENGKLLSSIKLLVEDTILESIITLKSSLKMNLQVDDKVTVLIPSSELSIMELL